MLRKAPARTAKKIRMTSQNKELTFVEHLEELRWRLIKSLACLVLSCIVFYHYIDQVLHFLIRPFGQLYFVSPSEALEAHVTLTLCGGVVLASPFILYQFWQFLAAAVNPEFKKNAVFFTALSFVLFVTGCAFAYFAVLPFSASFLLSFSSDVIKPMMTVSKYINFITTLIFSFGIIFEFPLMMLFLIQIGIATPEFLIQKRRYAIVAIFIISAVLTPPDYVSQLLMAFPLMGLYELSIFMAKWNYSSKHYAV